MIVAAIDFAGVVLFVQQQVDGFGNVTGIVDRLTEDGFAFRVAVEGDRRAMVVRLTDAGAAAFEGMAAAHEAWIDELLDGVGAEEAEAISARLAEVAERIE